MAGSIGVARNVYKTRRIARKAGIKIDLPQPHLPLTEQEETDTM